MGLLEPWRGGDQSYRGQARGRLRAPTVLCLQLGPLRGEVIEGALGFFELHAVFIGLVLQCPGHFLQVCLQAVMSR